MTATTTAAGRLQLAAHLDEVARALGAMFETWTTLDLPADVLAPEEYPFPRSLEDHAADVAAAAERIRARADETTVDVTIRLHLDSADTAELDEALHALADVMAVQAEDGVYSHGSPDAADDDNRLVARLRGYEVRGIDRVDRDV